MIDFKKVNAPFLAGSLILLILLSVVVMPGFYAEFNPYATETLKSYQDDGGNFKFMTPPFEPSEKHKLGTDEMGRDVLSLIVYGARLTIGISIVVVGFRFILSLIIGISAAFGNSLAQGIIRLSNIVFNFVPPLIICLIILKIRFFETLPKALSFWVFVFMLTLVGWSRVAEVVQSRSEDILRQDFIRSETSIGKNRLMIAITNVLPHIAAEVVVLAFMEIAVVLGLLMQLGAFMVFIGNLRIVENSDSGIIISKPMSFEPEWAAMMGASKTYLRSAPWLVFSPAVAFFISILGFNMFGEGLRKALQAQNSKVLIRTKKYLKPVVILLMVGAIVVYSTQISSSFTVLDQPERLPKYNRVRQGTEDMALWIENELKVMGYRPVEDSYQHRYDFEPYWITDDASVTNVSEDVYLEVEEDHNNSKFRVSGLGSGTYSGVVYDGRKLDVIGMELPEIVESQIILLEGGYYTESMIKSYITELSTHNLASAFIVKMPDLDIYSNLGTFDVGVPVIYVDDRFKVYEGNIVNIELECTKIQGQGINVFGMLEGKEEKTNDEVIIIGGKYNYENETDMSGLIAMLETAKAFAEQNDKLERRVIVAFWDGNYQSSGYGVLEYIKHTLYAPKDTAVYIDISANSSLGQVLMDESHAPHTRFYAWSLTQRAEKIGNAVGLKFTNDLTKWRPDLYKRGPSSIQVQLRSVENVISGKPSGSKEVSTKDSNEVSTKVSIEAFAGFIVDMVLGGAY